MLWQELDALMQRLCQSPTDAPQAQPAHSESSSPSSPISTPSSQSLSGQQQGISAAAWDVKAAQCSAGGRLGGLMRQLTCSDEEDEGRPGAGRFRELVLQDRSGLSDSGSEGESLGGDVDLAGLLQVTHLDAAHPR